MTTIAAMAASTVRISTPYAAGALGGTLSERGGVVNIALEGIMLTGAFAFVTASWWVSTRLGAAPQWLAPVAGLAAAVTCGFLVSLAHAVLTVSFKADNIISGLAINIFAFGATSFLLVRIFGSSSNSARVPSFSNWALFNPGGTLGAINDIFNPLIMLTIIMFVASQILLDHTRFGLRLRAAGENPSAADSLGVNVSRCRYSGVLLGGMAASVGGAWLASDQGLFSAGMTNGRGYIALAAMIIGKWRPWSAAGACLIFGFAEAAQNHLQIYKQSLRGLDAAALDLPQRVAATIPSQAIQAFPYLLTILVIAGFIGRSTPPAASGKPYETGNETA